MAKRPAKPKRKAKASPKRKTSTVKRKTSTVKRKRREDKDARFIREAAEGRAQAARDRKVERQRERRAEQQSKGWLERIATVTASTSTVVETTGTWMRAGHFVFDEPISQQDFSNRMNALEHARSLERSIGTDRRSQIVVEHTGHMRTAPSTPGPWDATVAQTQMTFDREQTTWIKARYRPEASALVTGFYVELSSYTYG